MKQVAFLLMLAVSAPTAAAVVAPAQPPPLPAGTHSAGSPQPATGTSNSLNSLDQAEEAMVKRDWPLALSLLEKHLATSGLPAADAGRTNYDIGFCDEALEKPQDAIDAYRTAIAADPTQFEAHAALGRLLLAQANTAEGRAQLMSATSLKPAAGDANAAKAEVYRALARIDRHDSPQQASAELIAALKLTPETLDDTLLSAEIAEASGDLPAAEAAYKLALLRSPDSVQATASLAHVLIREKKYGDAVLLAEHVHAVVPNDGEVTRLLANLYLETGDAAKAAALDAQLIASPEGSKDPALFVSRGEALLHQHDYVGAQQEYQQAATLNPALLDAWSGLAFAASENHAYSVALQALTMRSKLQPDPPAALFLRATTYDNLRQYKSAMTYYKRFLAVASGNFPDQEFEARHRLIALERMH